MRTSISFRILDSVQGRFVTVLTKNGKKVNGNVLSKLTRRSGKIIYIKCPRTDVISRIPCRDIERINGELCSIDIEG